MKTNALPQARATDTSTLQVCILPLETFCTNEEGEYWIQSKVSNHGPKQNCTRDQQYYEDLGADI